MKYYKDFLKLNVFSYEEAKRIINNSNPIKVLEEYIKKNYLLKIRRGLYAAIDLNNSFVAANKFLIGSKINKNSFISCHSAFEFYSSYNQVFNICQVGSLTRFEEFEFEEINYECFLMKSNKQINDINGVKVTSIERTIVDSIYYLNKAMDLEELLKCIDFLSKISEKKIIEMLDEYNYSFLYRKCGYILSYFQKELDLSDSFFEYCLKKSEVQNKAKISNREINELEYIKKWNLYAYKDLKSLIKQGEDIDV